MLPKSRRLTTEEFLKVFKNGRKSASSHFLITHSTQGSNKIAVVVPKKVEKSSVLRHRIKRRIFGVLDKIQVPLGSIILNCKTKLLTDISHKDLVRVIIDDLSKIK